MSRAELYYKVAKKFLFGEVVGAESIGESYNDASSTYNKAFLQVMQQYNIAMLSKLAVTGEARILDLACGTGFNANWLLQQYPNINIVGVDISDKMLARASEKLDGKAQLFNMDMLEYLRQCPKDSYDIVVCGWALKYQPPLEVLRECKRVLKNDGQIGVIVNTKRTLPEVRKVYTKLLMDNSNKLGNLMLELPNPRDQIELAAWFKQAGFMPIEMAEDAHVFRFEAALQAVEWVTSTGALAGFDRMLNLQDLAIKKQMAALFEKNGLFSITHTFVWGVARA